MKALGWLPLDLMSLMCTHSENHFELKIPLVFGHHGKDGVFLRCHNNIIVGVSSQTVSICPLQFQLALKDSFCSSWLEGSWYTWHMELHASEFATVLSP